MHDDRCDKLESDVTDLKRQLKDMRSTGCWIEIFDGVDLTGACAHLNGPLDLEKTDGIGWHDRIRSIRVGPNAFLDVWEDEGYGDSHMKFGPNSTVYDLSNDMDKTIDSLKITLAR